MTTLAYAALWLFVFSVPWERVIVITNMAIVTRATGALAAGLALLAVFLSGRFRRWHPFHVAALVFVLSSGIAVMILGLPMIPKKFWTFVQLFVVLWMTWELAVTKQRQLGLLTAYVFGSYVVAFTTIYVYLTHGGSLRRFSVTADADPNDLAMTVALAVPMAWYLGMTYRQPLMRLLCRAYLPLGLLVLGLTGSRGGMLTGVVGLLVIPLTMTKLSPGRLATTIVVLGLSGALAIAYIPQQTVDRLATTGTEVEDLSFGGRFKLWRAGLIAFTEKPIIGYGTSAFKTAVTPQLGVRAQVAHNSFLSVLVEQGLVGLVLYLAMLAAVFSAVLRMPRFERRFALVLFLTLLFTMLPLTWEDQKQVWIVFAMLIGMARAPDLTSSRPVPEPVPYYPPQPQGRATMAARSRQPWPLSPRPLDRHRRP